MTYEGVREKRINLVIQILIIVFFLGEMLLSDAYHMPYIAICIVALFSAIKNSRDGKTLSGKDLVVTIVFSIAFAMMITLSNYRIWSGEGYKRILLLIILAGAYISFFNILLRLKDITIRRERPGNNESKQVFLSTFLIIVFINVILLFFCYYPGVLSSDSCSQIEQIIKGQYSNHHPFYHTMIIKIFLDFGMIIFHEINAAVATFIVFQILFMAAVSGFAVMTVYNANPSKVATSLLVAFFAIMPYHIMFRMTMWKDVIFGGTVLLYTLFMYRNLKSVGNKYLNYIGFAASGVGFCILRSNGFFAFLGTTLIFLIVFRFKQKKVLLLMGLIILAGFMLKHPLLKTLGVAQPDIIEGLSIPAQQIARDVKDNKDFTEEESKLISQIADMESIPETYDPQISDPIKNLVREGNNQQIIRERKSDYIKLYISRFMKHPGTYIKAWIDQTKGYWNSGYAYFIWTEELSENNFGIVRDVKVESIGKMFNYYLSAYMILPAMQLFISIGLFVWCILSFLYVSIMKKDNDLIMISIPSLMVIASLLVATPVFSDFRYAYSIFCTMPVIGCLSFIDSNGERDVING